MIKTKLILSIFGTFLFILLPIKPIWIGLVLSGISGFLTGWCLVSYIKEKSKEDEKIGL